MDDYYSLLGVDADASVDDIRGAYRDRKDGLDTASDAGKADAARLQQGVERPLRPVPARSLRRAARRAASRRRAIRTTTPTTTAPSRPPTAPAPPARAARVCAPRRADSAPGARAVDARAARGAHEGRDDRAAARHEVPGAEAAHHRHGDRPPRHHRARERIADPGLAHRQVAEARRRPRGRQLSTTRSPQANKDKSDADKAVSADKKANNTAQQAIDQKKSDDAKAKVEGPHDPARRPGLEAEPVLPRLDHRRVPPRVLVPRGPERAHGPYSRETHAAPQDPARGRFAARLARSRSHASVWSCS